ncbi:MAG TPA: hypothetical protein VF503_26630 [Sphingobium sp.]|uniref:hypothetical protein n=1 Tax=Sphingobium sp. TaxID=1912891 RepID=UPI002ED4ED57
MAWTLGGPKGSLRWALAVVALGIATPALHAAPTYNGVDMTPAQIASAIEMFSSQLRAEISRLPANSSVEQFEAAILFITDQSGQPEVVVCAAFDGLRPDASIPSNAKVAMTNVCRMIKRRRGTGAVQNGSASPFGTFTSPSIVGGGGTNYSSQ